jgi:hypothetical protein
LMTEERRLRLGTSEGAAFGNFSFCNINPSSLGKTGRRPFLCLSLPGPHPCASNRNHIFFGRRALWAMRQNWLARHSSGTASITRHGPIWSQRFLVAALKPVPGPARGFDPGRDVDCPLCHPRALLQTTDETSA